MVVCGGSDAGCVEMIGLQCTFACKLFFLAVLG